MCSVAQRRMYCSHHANLQFFRQKALDEAGFELTKPSTGKELQQTTAAKLIQRG